MPEGKDYLAMRPKEPQDAEQHGVKGQRWGIRRSPAALKVAAAKRPDGESSSTEVKKTSGSESSSERYSRLAAQAKGGGGGKMSDDDLKFFNNRTEALKKVAKLNEQQPGWLSKTAKTVLQETAKRSMQDISNALADKYINDRIKASLKTAADAAESATEKK